MVDVQQDLSHFLPCYLLLIAERDKGKQLEQSLASPPSVLQPKQQHQCVYFILKSKSENASETFGFGFVFQQEIVVWRVTMFSPTFLLKLLKSILPLKLV